MNMSTIWLHKLHARIIAYTFRATFLEYNAAGQFRVKLFMTLSNCINLGHFSKFHEEIITYKI